MKNYHGSCHQVFLLAVEGGGDLMLIYTIDLWLDCLDNANKNWVHGRAQILVSLASILPSCPLWVMISRGDQCAESRPNDLQFLLLWSLLIEYQWPSGLSE